MMRFQYFRLWFVVVLVVKILTSMLLMGIYTKSVALRSFKQKKQQEEEFKFTDEGKGFELRRWE